MELPVFAYFPNAASDGTIAASDEVCSACGQARAYIARSILYTADPAGDGAFCPGLSFYLFRCPICGVHRAKWDMDQ